MEKFKERKSIRPTLDQTQITDKKYVLNNAETRRNTLNFKSKLYQKRNKSKPSKKNNFSDLVIENSHNIPELPPLKYSSKFDYPTLDNHFHNFNSEFINFINYRTSSQISNYLQQNLKSPNTDSFTTQNPKTEPQIVRPKSHLLNLAKSIDQISKEIKKNSQNNSNYKNTKSNSKQPQILTKDQLKDLVRKSMEKSTLQNIMVENQSNFSQYVRKILPNFFDKEIPELMALKVEMLQNLIKINKIPANFFLFGKDCNKFNYPSRIEDVAAFVNIKINNDKNISVRPKENIKDILTTLSELQINSTQASFSVKKNTFPRGENQNILQIFNFNKKFNTPTQLSYKTCSLKKTQDSYKEIIEKNLLNLYVEDKKENIHKKHPINIAIKNLNKLGKVLFKQNNDNFVLIETLSSRVGLKLHRNEILREAFQKNVNLQHKIKVKMVKYLFDKLNEENNIEPFTSGYRANKFFLTKANNSNIVKASLNTRKCWIESTDPKYSNFIWTQLYDFEYNSRLESQQNNNCMDEEIDKITYLKTKLVMTNHVDGSEFIGNKKTLYQSLKYYFKRLEKDVFNYIPLTFLLDKGIDSQEFCEFEKRFLMHEKKKDSKNIWIIKPGENSNRGQGILLSNNLDEIVKIIQNKEGENIGRTFIVQKYIENPLLFRNRKFDIRCFSLITCFNGNVKAYFYKHGYLRTSSFEYSTFEISNRYVHLTNEAVQINLKEFGKYEPGNKLYYFDLQDYLDERNIKVNFVEDVVPKMKKYITHTIRANYFNLDPMKRRHNFELFGFDFLLDENFNLYLIEGNYNPCLEIWSSVTAQIVPSLLDNVFRIALDPIFQPPLIEYINQKKYFDSLPEIQMELIFDSSIEEKGLQKILNPTL